MKYEISNMVGQIIHADCYEVLKELPSQSVDLVLTDPPYGIGADSKSFCNRTSGRTDLYCANVWDSVRLSKLLFSQIVRVSKNQIVWGGNYFADMLPQSKCWLVWNKRTGENSYADCELAYTSFFGCVKMFDWAWIGARAKDLDGRFHPTQKPVPLFKWCIDKYSKPVVYFEL